MLAVRAILARGGGEASNPPGRRGKLWLVRAARCCEEARLHASQCFHHAVERELETLGLLDVGKMAYAYFCRKRRCCVSPELGLKYNAAVFHASNVGSQPCDHKR